MVKSTSLSIHRTVTYRPASDGLFGSIGSGPIAILAGGLFGATVSMITLGVGAAGVTVAVMASQATPVPAPVPASP